MPRRRVHPAFLLLAALLLAFPVAAQQPNAGSSQQSSQSATQPKTAQHKKQAAKDKDAKNIPAPQQNAFPEAESEKAARQAQHPDQQQTGQQNPPAAPAPQSKTGASAADRNPFPEAESEKAARQAQQTQNAAPANSSSSAVPGLNLPAKAGHLPAAPVQNISLGRKDVKVGMFYLQSGDWKGAYDRFAEATQVDPESAEAVYGLAASAQHLGYREIAIRNYKLYLSAVPDGRYDKDCRKALKDLGVHP